MLTRALGVVLPLTMLTACTNAIGAGTSVDAQPTTESARTVVEPAAATPPPTIAKGTFMPYRPGSVAITYDPAVVPPGASATLTIIRTGYGTEVRLAAGGLVPRRTYGAHLHVHPCTALPAGAGAHYQNHKDPAATPTSPSVNPVYANPRNEIWLDFTADAAGMGSAVATHGWDLDPQAPPRSLILHAEHTHMGPGEAGKAGDRAACLTLPAS